MVGQTKTFGLIKGTRIPVKLPWKGATDGEDQFVSMKQPVAEFLKMQSATKADLTYEVKVKKKGEATSTVTVKRRRRPGYRQRSIMVQFGLTKNGKQITKSIGGKSVSSIQFPITKSVPIDDVVTYFESGAGKSLGIRRVVDVNSGQGYPVII